MFLSIQAKIFLGCFIQCARIIVLSCKMFFDILLEPCSKVTSSTFEVTEACFSWLFLAEKNGMAEIRPEVLLGDFSGIQMAHQMVFQLQHIGGEL